MAGIRKHCLKGHPRCTIRIVSSPRGSPLSWQVCQSQISGVSWARGLKVGSDLLAKRSYRYENRLRGLNGVSSTLKHRAHELARGR
jgi:hypothetical protein